MKKRSTKLLMLHRETLRKLEVGLADPPTPSVAPSGPDFSQRTCGSLCPLITSCIEQQCAPPPDSF